MASLNGKGKLVAWCSLAFVIVVAIVGGAVGYGTLSAIVADNADTIRQLKSCQDALADTISDMKVNQASMDSKLEFIIEELRRLR